MNKVEEWWKSVCQEHNCKYYMHEDYPKCSYCTCPDNCAVIFEPYPAPPESVIDKINNVCLSPIIETDKEEINDTK